LTRELRSLYIHIPFCRNKCAYCDFTSFKIKNKEEVSRYIDYVIRELEFYRGENLRTLYIGGGNPSVVQPTDCDRLLRHISELFCTDSLVEFTVESNPETLTRSLIKLWSAHGVNRISLGVQTFDNDVLKKVGRQTRNLDILTAVDLLKEERIDNLNLDLILGIAATDIYRADLKKAVALKPTHLAVYILGLSGKTPLSQMVARGEFSELTSEEYEKLFGFTAYMLSQEGFRRYEISNYAQKGYESHHNLNYWMGGEYIGVGLAAVSAIGSKRTWNTRSLVNYYKKLDRGFKPTASSEYISGKKRLYERVMLMLRTATGISLEELRGITSEDKLPKLNSFILMLQEQELAEHSENLLILTTAGLFRSSLIISELWSFIDKSDTIKS